MAGRVVIAGGGCGGFYAARRLERVLPPQSAHVTLVTDVNYLLYTPLLPGAAAGTLEPRHVVVPLRERLKRTELRLGWVTGGDLASNSLHVELAAGQTVWLAPGVVRNCLSDKYPAWRPPEVYLHRGGPRRMKTAEGSLA